VAPVFAALPHHRSALTSSRVPRFEAVRLALGQIRVQKLKSFCTLMLKASNTMAMFDGMALVREAMRARRHLRPAQPSNLSIETSESALEDVNEVKTVITVTGTALPMIGLVVGGLVIMNIMLVSVAERTHEIGIRTSPGGAARTVSGSSPWKPPR
jgi:hypothetical protein